MSHFPEDQAVEKRRKVLKGALAASGVATMGYSGSALASFNCLQKTTLVAPFDGGQLVQMIPSAYSGWTWAPVEVYPDNGSVSSGKFNYLGYAYAVSLSKIGNSWSAISNPMQLGQALNLSGNKITMYLLVLYGPSLTGSGYGPVAPTEYVAGLQADPGANLPAQMPQPAFQSCLTSLNPGIAGSASTGG